MRRDGDVPRGPGQESVWDYPRPPRLERVDKRLRVVLEGVTLAETTQGKRVLETSHRPSSTFLRRTSACTTCWRGVRLRSASGRARRVTLTSMSRASSCAVPPGDLRSVIKSE